MACGVWIGPNAVLQAAKAYENHRAENGDPDDHSKAKEIMCVAFAPYCSPD